MEKKAKNSNTFDIEEKEKLRLTISAYNIFGGSEFLEPDFCVVYPQKAHAAHTPKTMSVLKSAFFHILGRNMPNRPGKQIPVFSILRDIYNMINLSTFQHKIYSSH